MYEIFAELCRLRGVSAYQVSKATGVSTATLSEWKKGKYLPKADKIAAIAAYFNVTEEYLRTGKDTRYETSNADLIADVIGDMKLMEALKKYMTLSDEKKNHVLEMINLLSAE